MFTKALKASRRGFTLIEIMIVVLIIGILLAIAVPNFVKARESSRAKACISNLKQIQSSIQQWAMDTRQAGSATVTRSAIFGTGNYIVSEPKCPSTDAAYGITTVDTNPTCPNPGTAGDVNEHILK